MSVYQELVYYIHFLFLDFLRHLDMEIFLYCVLWPKIPDLSD